MMLSRELIELLRESGPIEWCRHFGGHGVDGVPVAPLVVWRFAQPAPAGIDTALLEIVSSGDLEVNWTFDASHRNWVLLPTRLQEVKQQQGFATEAQAAALLRDREVEFSRQAARDLEKIAARMKGSTYQNPHSPN